MMHCCDLGCPLRSIGHYMHTYTHTLRRQCVGRQQAEPCCTGCDVSVGQHRHLLPLRRALHVAQQLVSRQPQVDDAAGVLTGLAQGVQLKGARHHVCKYIYTQSRDVLRTSPADKPSTT